MVDDRNGVDRALHCMPVHEAAEMTNPVAQDNHLSCTIDTQLRASSR